MGGMVCCGIMYLFYHSFLITVISSTGTFVFVKYRQREKIKTAKWKLTLEFKDAILSLSNALIAGYSIENAFEEALRELEFLYEPTAEIMKELKTINQQIRLNRNVEDLLMEFGNRTGVEDILNFAEVVMTAKRTGGDLIKIMKSTSESIGEKIEVQREIKTLIAAKKLEGMIMCVIPFGIIVYLNICMPGFLEPMYEGLVGRGIMSLALIGYLGGIALLNKIVTIRI